ncbi:MAG: hypothetical protein DCC58_03030 [Chloroflexi bacterium]|nr:MAG: hypothetical protein DCC58_03030 [Chloroflexota bacterium]
MTGVPAMLPSPMRAATLELSQARLHVLDPRATVEFLADRGVNTLVCFAVGYARGEAYYPSEVVPHHPDLGERDIVGDVCATTHARGMAFIAYVNGLFGGPEVYEAHPDWTQRWRDGRESTQGEAKMLCPNSPYRALIVAASAEVAARYPLDGFYFDEPSLQSWCACHNCSRRYLADTGHELPLDPLPGTEEFGRFLSWRTGIVSEYVADVAAAVREARPGVAFFAQHAFPLASSSQATRRRLFWGRQNLRLPPEWENWYRPTFYGQDIAAVGAHLDLIGIEPWRRWVGQPAWWQGACVSYARSAGRGKPVLSLMEYPHFPWGIARLSDSELAVTCADTVANGGDLWFAMYAPDAADREGWDALQRVFADLGDIRPRAAEQVAHVAILVSRTTAERFGRNAVDERYLDDVIGMVQVVRELHVPYMLLAEDTLDATSLADVLALVIPSGASLSATTVALVREYVASGGTLLATGWAATHDAQGERESTSQLADVLGVQLGPGTVHAGVGYLVARDGDGPPVPVRDEAPAVAVDGAQVLFDVLPSWEIFGPPPEGPLLPDVTLHAYGAGQALYCGIQIGRLRRRFEVFEMTGLVRRLLASAGATAFPLQGVSLAPEVGLHAWRCGAELRLLLVNYTSVELGGHAAPVARQSLRIASPLLPTSPLVRAWRSSRVETTHHDAELLVTLPELGDWDCITIAPEAPTALAT